MTSVSLEISTRKKVMTRNGDFPRPAEIDPYVPQQSPYFSFLPRLRVPHKRRRCKIIVHLIFINRFSCLAVFVIPQYDDEPLIFSFCIILVFLLHTIGILFDLKMIVLPKSTLTQLY